MANKALFASTPGKLLPSTDVRNEAGGVAYALGPKAALAQFAATGCLNGTFYANAETQLNTVLALARETPPEFVAKTAVFAREQGQMKDMPALLVALLAATAPDLLPKVFARVIDSPKMLRNFVQIVRSGVTGRKSLGSRPKRLVQQWLDAADERILLNASVGQSPSLADIVKMIHPRPVNPAREAFYGWLIGRKVEEARLPECVQAFEQFKRGELLTPPALDFRLLSGLPLTREHWQQMARNMSWQALRQNLNTLGRKSAFQGESGAELAALVAAKLRDAEAMGKARVLPYQVLTAYRNVGDGVPLIVREALQDALDIALAAVPELPGRVVVALDVSGSMRSAVTGARGSATSVVSCAEVASLIAAALLRRNLQTRVLAFDTAVYEPRLNPRDSVATNTAALARLGGGGTALSAPLGRLVAEQADVDALIFVSDNQSWADTGAGLATATMVQWQMLKVRNPAAKLVCVDLQPYATAQAPDSADVLNVGGFSDAVFGLVAGFLRGEMDAGHWVAEIEKIEL